MTNLANYNYFVQDIMGELPRCPETVVEDACQRAVVEFFDRSFAWTVEPDPLYLEANETEYLLSGAVSGVAGGFGGLPWEGNKTYELGDLIQGVNSATAYKFECVKAGTSDDTQDVSTAWATLTAYTVGDQLGVTSGGVEYLFECIASGTSGASEPTWPTDELESVIDGTVAWQNSGYNYAEPTWPATEGQAVIDGTVIWQNKGTVTVLPANADVVSVLWLKKNGSELTGGKHYTFDPRTRLLRFVSAPVTTDKIELKLAVKPKYGQTLIPDVLVQQYFEIIKAGVLWRLLSQPEKFWTDLKKAGVYFDEWRGGIGRVRGRMLNANTTEPLRVQAREFGHL